MSEYYDLVVVGKGVASSVFLYTLGQYRHKLKVLTIHAPQMAFACSLNSTGVVSENGLAHYNGSLGKRLFDAYKKTSQFIHEKAPRGVEPCLQYHLRFSGEDKSIDDLKRRYGYQCEESHLIKEIDFPLDKSFYCALERKAFCISPSLFLDWLEEKNNFIFNEQLQVVEDFVCEVDDQDFSLKTLGGRHLYFKKILFAAGAFNSQLSSGVRPGHQSRDNSKASPSIVAGSFFEAAFNLGTKSFIISFTDFNLIYRHGEQKVLLGGTSGKDAIIAKDWPMLLTFLKQAQKIIPALPGQSAWKTLTGLRQKGPRRRPYWGPCEGRPKGFYEISSLYKNGYTLPFLASPDLLKKMYG